MEFSNAGRTVKAKGRENGHELSGGGGRLVGRPMQRKKSLKSTATYSFDSAYNQSCGLSIAVLAIIFISLPAAAMSVKDFEAMPAKEHSTLLSYDFVEKMIRGHQGDQSQAWPRISATGHLPQDGRQADFGRHGEVRG